MQPLTAVALASGALVLLLRPRSASARTLALPADAPAGTAPTDAPATVPVPSRCARTPDVYAVEKLPMLRRWYAGPEGTALRRYLPLLAAGPLRADAIPVAAWLGFASNSSGRLDDTVNPRFHEWGLYGLESFRWERYRADPRVRAALGRTPSSDWRDLDTQTCVGVLSLLDHYAASSRGLEVPPWGSWPAWVNLCIAWQVGDGGARRLWLAAQRAVLDAPDAERWRAWAAALSHVPGRNPGTHGWPLYSLLRAAQKWRAGQALASAVGNLPEWCGPAMPATLQSSLTLGACQR